MEQTTKSGDRTKDKGLTENNSDTLKYKGAASKHYFDRMDWVAFWVTFAISILAYFWTVAPDLTLEDSGELAVASHYAGVPHPPGYPIWTIYTWVFTKIFPFSNIAFRVAVSSAVAGVLASAMLSLIVSRGSRRLLRGFNFLESLPQDQENWIRVLSGVIAGLLLTFDSVLWSQSVIVEVYSFAACSFVASLLFLFRWTDSPNKNWYLYLCFLMFGIAVTNHQTLICAAMGIELVICFVRPILGRNFIAANSLVFLLAIILKAINPEHLRTLDNAIVMGIFWLVGLLSIAGFFFMTFVLKVDSKQNKSEDEVSGFWKIFRHVYPILICGVIFLLTHLTYFYMPLTSMTNPPMNWGFPRTVEGFEHAIFRGQYEPIKPTESFGKFVGQGAMVTTGIVEEFSIALTLLGLLPFVFIHKMRRREQAWWLGMAGVFIGISIILLILLNPGTDALSKFQTRVFFIPAHSIVAMSIGCAFALVCGFILQKSREISKDFIAIGAFAFAMVSFANAGLIFVQYNYILPRIAYVLVFAGALLFLGLLKIIKWFEIDGLQLGESHPRIIKVGMSCLGACLISFSAIAHWSDSEQRGHLFGYWFGHDMFDPPFGVYPEMEKGAILLGGTDPGRFCPTYMIFSESVMPASTKRDPEFDRRDVYLITQNALADITYLDYLRAHYDWTVEENGIRKKRSYPPFFQNLLFGEKHAMEGFKPGFPWFGIPKALDNFFINNGERVEARRRKERVYPEEEIYIPTDQDAALAYQDYQREVLEKLRAEGRVGVNPFENGEISGTESVMALNSRLSKILFRQNSDKAFYIEESYAFEWMYPYLSPFGIIMKLNRNPLEEISQEMVDKDRAFWDEYSKRLIGDWLDEDTTIENVCSFAIDLLSFKDVSDYPVNPKFFRDIQAQKSFSKLRGSQGELFAWRYRNASSPEEQARMYKAGVFALTQAFCFHPGSPEAVHRLSTLLYQGGRLEEAMMIARTATLIDPKSPGFRHLLLGLEQASLNGSSGLNNGVQILQGQLTNFLTSFEADPLNLTNTISLIDTLWSLNKTNEALRVVDDVVLNQEADQQLLTVMAQKVADIPDLVRLESILTVISVKFPDNPSVFYDLASLQAFKGKPDSAITNLVRALELSQNRLKVNPEAKDLTEVYKTDQRFSSLKNHPQYEKLITPLLSK